MSISNVSYTSDFTSKYQKGMEMSFKLDGHSRVGEFNRKMGSVAILIFNVELKSFLLVTQFRPAIFTSIIANLPENVGKEFNDISWEIHDPQIGYTVELCAGLIDKEGLTPEQIASEEIAEECGYRVEPDQLVPIASFVVGAHQSGNAQFLYYAEVDESQKISEGGGNIHEGEVIQKVHWSVEQAEKVLRPAEGGFADLKGPPGVLFAFQWWFLGKGKIPSPSSYHWQPRNVKTIQDVSFSEDFDKKKYGYDPRRMEFTMNSITRTWDLALCPDTAAVILVDMAKKELILLQTFRAPVLIGQSRTLPENVGKSLEEIDYSKSDPKLAYTLELPVHRVRNGENPRKFARNIVKQLGYDLKEDVFQLVAKCIPGIGQSGDNQYIFAVDVSGARICENEADEDIEELRVPFSALPALFVQQMIGPPNTYFAIGHVLEKMTEKTFV